MIVAGLPPLARWMLRDTPLDFDFSDARLPLHNVSSDEVTGEIEEEWADLLVFGRYNYAEGGGASPWIAIRRSNGRVCGLDVEREDPIFEFNSCLERFIRTFSLLDRSLRHGESLPPGIEEGVRQIDPESYSRSDWRLMIEYLVES